MTREFTHMKMAQRVSSVEIAATIPALLFRPREEK